MTPATLSRQLLPMYRAMHGRWGERRWWPSRAGAETPEGKLEICVGTILTQNTNWRNVETAIANLLAAGKMTVGRLHRARPETLAKLIRPAGYFNVKARRLQSFIARVHTGFGGDIAAFLDRPLATLRPALLGVNGIGPETADSICLYAAGLATFVVDAYTRRIFLRHGLITPASADYKSIKRLCETHLPAEVALYNDYHAQLVETGKHYCKPTARCDGCPLASFPHDPRA
ncbi:MAG: endonuclease III domain-containing protein [Phycisphaerae bacterium]|nr:endonuclease III domain-containing protein [Phycisphaerae bacterium]